MLSALELTLILLLATVGAVVMLRAFGLPPLVAYLVVGIVLGPHAAGLAADDASMHGVAEIGVVFLMFTLGLEFNLAKLLALRRFVFGLGAGQVALTLLACMAILLALPHEAGDWLMPGTGDWRAALAVGGALAMSSTAMVTKLLAERRELETEHGRRVFSVLLFQDLAVIPLLIVIPALAAGADASAGHGLAVSLALAALKALVLLFLLMRFGPALVRRWFSLVARQRSRELFTLNVLLAALLFGWLTRQAGLSMELGAFVAGMLIAETEFRYQVEEDIKPFRDVLLGFFFVTIGMKLDTRMVLEAWPQVLVLLAIPVLLKFVIVVGLVRGSGASAGVAVRSGVWLAQIGEFGFVLLAQALLAGIVEPRAVQPLLAAMLLSLLVSPLLIAQANRLALRASAQEWLQRSLQLQTIASRSITRKRHVILCGYGRCGQSLARVLEAEQVEYVALDLDPDRVREAAAAGEPVVYGDALRRETLLAAGLHRAVTLAITFDDTAAALHLLHQVRELAPALPVLVRSASDVDIERLRAAGATEVVPEIVEGSLMIASHALVLAGVPASRVWRRVREIREGRYKLLKGFFPGADDREHDTIEQTQTRLQAVAIPAEAGSVGCMLGQLPLDGVSVSAIVRHTERIVDPQASMRIEAGDTIVLSGTVERIAAAEERLLGRRSGAAV